MTDVRGGRNCIPGVAVMIVLLLWRSTCGVTAVSPEIPDCGAPEVKTDSVLFTQDIDVNGDVIEPFSITSEEGIVLQVGTGNRRRQRRLGQGRRNLQLEQILFLCGGESGSSEEDDLVPQPLNNDDEDDGCDVEDIEDDDGDFEDQDLGGSSQVTVEILDALSGVLSRKVDILPSDSDPKFLMWMRGQKSTCGHPARVRVQVDEGEGRSSVQVTATTLGRSKWNRAALTFVDAVDVGTSDSQKGWCGSINWFSIDHPDPECNTSVNTPKWKVWLNPNDKLLVAGEFYSRSDVDEEAGARVQLNVFRASNNDVPVDTIIDARIVARKERSGEYVNPGSASWFYIELFRTRRQLYEYGIGFEVERCKDQKPGRFVLPKNDKTCGWLSMQSPMKIRDICGSTKSNASSSCQRTCGCSSCSESPTTGFHIREQNCKYLQKKRTKLENKGKFERYCAASIAGTTCPETCGQCPSGPSF